MNQTTCRCLYCSKVTGSYPSLKSESRSTVCSDCTWGSRDEAREVAAGMRPWMRPPMYPFLNAFLRRELKWMPDHKAAAAQARWDAEQERIKQFNREHAGSGWPK